MAEGESAGLEAISEGGSLIVRRVEDEETTRLRLDLVLGPGRTVRLRGSDLVVRVDDPEAGTDRSAFHLALESSRAELAGARVGELELVDSSLLLSGTDGSLTLTLDRGSADLRRHRGSLELAATAADVTVVDHQGTITPRLDGGSLEVSGGAGTVAGTANRALLVLDQWRGPVELDATDTAVDARGVEGDRSPWRLAGEDLQVLLEEVRGPIAVDLRGGSLLGSGLVDLRASAAGGARVELAGVAGTVGLELSGGAEAYLADMTGNVEAAVSGARLEAERIGRLALSGARGEVAVRGVERLESLAMSDSQLELDLRAVLHDPSLELRGAGFARVWLPAPCIVQSAGGGDGADVGAGVTGCEVQPPGRRTTPRQGVARYGRRPTRLTVSADRDVVLDVEGVEDER